MKCRKTRSQHGGTGKRTDIVMNANPFTRGHQYLAEKAAAACDTLHLFIVSEDASLVPFLSYWCTAICAASTLPESWNLRVARITTSSGFFRERRRRTTFRLPGSGAAKRRKFSTSTVEKGNLTRKKLRELADKQLPPNAEFVHGVGKRKSEWQKLP